MTRAPSAALLLLIVALLTTGCASKNTPEDAYRAGDFRQSFALYEDKAKAGDAAAQNRLAVHYYVGLGTQRDMNAAFQWFEAAALAGNATAQRNLGLMYMKGLGVKSDVDLAFGWLDLAQRNGNRNVVPLMTLMPGKLTPNQMQRVRQRLAADLAERREKRAAQEAAPEGEVSFLGIGE